MTRKGRFWIFLLLTGLAPEALALDLDFYTYGAFEQTVNAFERVSLIFANDNYTILILLSAILGLFIGGTAFFAKATTQGPSSGGFPLGFALLFFFGIAIFKASVWQKGTVHVYDPVQNSYQAVSNVPDLLVVVAGALNKIERLVADIESSASAFPYDRNAGGVSFSLLFNVTTAAASSSSHYLDKSVKQYFSDCSEIPLVQNGSGLDLQTLRSGATDLLTVLSTLAYGGNFTQYFDLNNKGGITLSCSEAWNTHLRPALTAPGFMDQTRLEVCAAAGFNAGDPNQLSSCTSKLDELGLQAFNVSADHVTLLRNAYLSSLITDSLAASNPDVATRVLTNRDMMTDGIGAAINAQEWVQQFRSILFTIVLSLTPVLIAFLVTPLVGKALFLVVMLFMWISIWGIIDIFVTGVALDQSFAVMADIQRHSFGLDAFLMAPSDSMKALALFGKFRGYGATVATIVTGGIFGFSAYSLSGVSQSIQSNLDRSGEQASDKALSPESRGSLIEGVKTDYAVESTISRVGAPSYFQASAWSHGVQTATSTGEQGIYADHGYSAAQGMQAQANYAAGSSAARGLANASLSNQPELFEAISSGPQANNAALATGIAETTMAMSGTAAVGQSMRDLGFSTPSSGAHFRSYMESNRSLSDGLTTEQAWQRYREDTQSSISLSDFAQLRSSYDQASSEALITQSRGDVSNYRDLLSHSTQSSLGHMTGRREGVEAIGVSAFDASRASGRAEQFGSVAEMITQGTYSPAEIIDAYSASKLSGVSSGFIMNRMASEYGADGRSYFEGMATSGSAPALAKFLAASSMAESVDQSLLETSLSLNNTGYSLAVTPDNIGAFYEAGLISDEQLSTFERNGGYGRLDFAYDSEAGVASDSRASSGWSATSNNTLTVNDAKSYSDSLSFDSAFVLQSGTARSLVLDNDTSQLASVLSLIDDQDPEVTSNREMAFDEANAQWMSSVVSKQANEADGSRFNASVGAGITGGVRWDSKDSVVTGLISRVTGGSAMANVTATGDVNQSYFRSGQDSASYNANLDEAREMRIQATASGTRAAVNEVNSIAAERFKETGEEMPMEERLDLKRDLAHQYSAQYLHEAMVSWQQEAISELSRESSGMKSGAVEDKIEDIQRQVDGVTGSSGSDSGGLFGRFVK